MKLIYIKDCEKVRLLLLFSAAWRKGINKATKHTIVAGSQKLTLIEKEHCSSTKPKWWRRSRKTRDRMRATERTATASKRIKYKNEPDKWTMPLMITDKPVAHIWNFIFLYAQRSLFHFAYIRLFLARIHIQNTNYPNHTHFKLFRLFYLSAWDVLCESHTEKSSQCIGFLVVCLSISFSLTLCLSVWQR